MGAYVIAELGINHNGDIGTCQQLIRAAVESGADAVKFQKRTLEQCYDPDLLKSQDPKWPQSGCETEWDWKCLLEFDSDYYTLIDRFCASWGIDWSASAWDVPSVEFLEQFDIPWHKVPSARLTDDELLEAVAKTGRRVLLSTGMSTQSEIIYALGILEEYGADVTLCQCTSTYPCPDEELDLGVIKTWLPLAENGVMYSVDAVGYSGHEKGIATTVAAVALGASVIERHLTLDRTMWGSDHAASLEPHGFARMVRDIRAVEAAMGDGEKHLHKSELPARDKLRC